MHDSNDFLIDQWTALRQQPVVERRHPPAAWTLEQLLPVIGQTGMLRELETVLEHFRRAREVACTPIIGVLGEVNAGKSSVVATFLSSAGRQRLPRGLEEACGTHRFVYWCPHDWLHDDNRQRVLLQLLADAHGCAPETLREQPEQAALQYRSGRDQPDRLTVPLLAYDHALRHFALLDTPDIQTEDPLPTHTQQPPTPHNQRLAFVAQAARICSAFLFVWDRSKIRDRLAAEFLQKVRHNMPRIPLYLLINKVRPHPDALSGLLRDGDIRRIRERFDITDIYVAMDFDIPQWDQYTPAGLIDLCGGAEKMPCFFRLTPEAAADPQHVPPSGWLPHSLHHLPPAELQQKVLASHREAFLCRLRELLRSLDAWIDDCRQRTFVAHHGLLLFCTRLFQDSRGEPLQIYDPHFNEKLNKAILDYAPWYVRLANWFNDHIREGANRIRQFIPILDLKMKIDEWKNQLKNLGEGFMDPSDLALQSLQQRWVPADWPQDQLVKAWKTVLDHLQKFQHEVRAEDLEPMARDFWQHAPPGIGWRSALAILGSTAAVAGLVTAAIDGGATLLASYSMAGALSSALPGLGALTVGALGTSAALAVFYAGLIQHNSLPHLAAFFALACDAFGLPRRLLEQPLTATFGRGENARTLPLPHAEVPPLPPVCPLPQTGLWHWTAAGVQLRQLVQSDPT